MPLKGQFLSSRGDDKGLVVPFGNPVEEVLVVAFADFASQQQLATIRRRSRRRGEKAAVDQMRHLHEQTVAALAAALELRDDETGAHAQRVTSLAMELTKQVAPELADDPSLRFGFLLHDIGKIGVPDAILLKNGPLTPAEQELMQQHTVLGEQLIAAVPHLRRGVVRDVIVHHHERWDGGGYPWGLAGAEIPLAARIFAVADAFDAMTNPRPYKPAIPVGRALEEIIRNAGTQFDQDIATAFVELAARRFRHELSGRR